MGKAGAGSRAPALKSEELPEWVKVVNDFAKGQKKEVDNKDSKNNSQNGSRVHLALSSGLYRLVIQRIKELEKYSNHKSGIIRFPTVFKKLCASFQITKEQAWELLFLFSDLGFLEIVPYQGIRVKNSKSVAESLLRL